MPPNAVFVRLVCGGAVEMRSGDGIGAERNRAALQFLDGKAEWFFWYDGDIGFMPDAVDRLLEVAEPLARPIVAALCFQQSEQEVEGALRTIHTPAIFDGKPAGFVLRSDYFRNTFTRVFATRAACILIHRSALERMSSQFGPVWFSAIPDVSSKQLNSEDLSFCIRAFVLGIPIYVHTGVGTMDSKQPRLVEEQYWRQRSMNSRAYKLESEHKRSRPLRFAAIPTHNRMARLHALVQALGTQCDIIIILDNASSPPVEPQALQPFIHGGIAVEVIREEEQPPHLSRFWNVMFDRARQLAEGHAEWDIAVFNDDAIVPAGWYDAVATALREHPTAAAAATDWLDLQKDTLVWTEPDINPEVRMCPFAFVVRGEQGLRSDESMRWYWFDLDFDWQARLSGGVVSIPGLRVVNAHAGSSTVGPLAELAGRDCTMFARKWGRNPW